MGPGTHTQYCLNSRRGNTNCGSHWANQNQWTVFSISAPLRRSTRRRYYGQSISSDRITYNSSTHNDVSPNSMEMTLSLWMGWLRLRCNINWTTYWRREKSAPRRLWIARSQEICDGDSDQHVTNRTWSCWESWVLQSTCEWLSVQRMQKRTYYMPKQFWPIRRVKSAMMLGFNP